MSEQEGTVQEVKEQEPSTISEPIETTENPTQNPSEPSETAPHLTYRQRSASAASEKQLKSSNHEENALNKPSLSELSDKMFTDFIELLSGEMQAGFNELSLVEQMNQAISKKYETMNQRTDGVKNHLQKMMKMYEGLQSSFQEVDQIEGSVNELNDIVNYLDHYTKQLELQLKPYL